MIGSYLRHGNKAEVQVPVGLERLLLLAAADPDLRARLKADPRTACAGLGFDLSASERELLGSLAPSALDAMIDGLAPKRQRNTRFLRKVAAAAVAGGMLVASCQADDDVCGGAAPDVDSDMDSDADADAGPDSGS